MKISELFGLKQSQHELDFVDVDIDSDTPLFLDPYFIAKNDFGTNVKYYNGKLKELYDICDSLGVVFPSEQEDKHTYIDDKYVVKKFI